ADYPACNTYFSVSALKPDASGARKRRKENFSRQFVVVLDDSPPLPGIEATWILETSQPEGRSNTQIGFLLTDPITDIGIAGRLNQALADAGHLPNDKSGNNPVRYVRLPVGSNTKHQPAHQHRLLAWNPDGRVTLDELIGALGFDRDAILNEPAPQPKPERVRADTSHHDRSEGGFFRSVKDAALANMDCWVPVIFPSAKPYQGGYRVTSKSLGRPHLEEDLSLHPSGIKDHGEEHGLTAIDVVMKWGTPARTANEAALWLCSQIGIDPVSLGWNEPTPDVDFSGKSDQASTGVKGERARTDDRANQRQEGEWPEPQPITVQVSPEAYPLDALPRTVRMAVEEVRAFVKAPLALIASCSLSALSVAIQGHYDIKRAEKLVGPVSLDLLTIGDSGERKTTVDGFFTAAIRAHEAKETEAAKPELKRYAANMASWKSKQEGVLAATRDAAKKAKNTDELDAEMELLQLDEPEAPRVPKLLMGDETPENMAWSLAKNWPSSGVISSEAGLIFGAHGMGKDSIMRNLALLNILWDGGTHSVGRRTSESFVVKGARLTVALQIQETTLRSFFDRAGGLARGTGFLARFLLAWPESTQGYRPFTEAPEAWPHLALFNRRLTDILEQPVPLTDDGTLEPVMLTLSPEAKAAWIAFHDAIEEALKAGGELHDVRDVASKTADNAVRIAALFHIFEGGIGPVSMEAFEGASQIAAWHLTEARRFFGELAIPEELVDAAKLDAWLVEHCLRHRIDRVSKRYVRQHGPLRDGSRLETAIQELVEMDRLRAEKEGRRTILLLNPALCEGGL
ncbi:hypothetical protein CCR95_16900, partial [Thiocystis minor]|uniref:YfjI family protein n=1 Tax=Thiocystis minor TaxID=61597 RepID=UPI0019127869